MKKHTRCLVFILGTSDIQRLVVCEGGTANLSCTHHADNKVIHVLSAIYGRKDRITCRPIHSDILYTTCKQYGYDSLRIDKQICEGQQSCQFLVSRHVFGDPCPGISKYLELSYQCIFKQGMYG